MNCEDLMNMKEIRNGLKLVAGDVGISRNIRWIYFADCIQCLNDNFDIGDFIHEEELVIITNLSLTANDQRIIGMIDAMYEKNVAGFVINEGQISEAIIKYCNELKLPLFELSLSLHLVDFSQIVCKILIHEENNMNSIEKLLASILYSEKLDTKYILEQANYLGVNISGAHCSAVFQVCKSDDLWEKEIHGDDGHKVELSENIKKIIRKEFRFYGLRNIMIYSQINYNIIMFPFNQFSKSLLITIFGNIIKAAKTMYGVTLNVGVGTDYEYLDEFRYSYQEARNTLRISEFLDSSSDIFFYNDLGIYSLLVQITNGKFMDNYVDNKLGKLIEADKLQNSNLCETLECYLNNNCNANATAEDLYIHRNTMRYRMEKIKKIIEEDVSDLAVAMELKFAFAIKRYREIKDER